MGRGDLEFESVDGLTPRKLAICLLRRQTITMLPTKNKIGS